MKIDEELIPFAYKLSLEVFLGDKSLKDAVKELSFNEQMNKNSARDYINNFGHLIRGERFTRTLNKFSMNYFLNKIHEDFGRQGLHNSIIALKQHINYYEEIQNARMRGMRDLVVKYSEIIVDKDQQEQNEIIEIIKVNKKSKKEIWEELKSIDGIQDEKITINGKVYKRDNKTIANIKYVRDFKCQICNSFILKKDGTRYIEAAHIVAKHKKGRETIDNIILLCPNHHKEFDLGDREIIEHDGNQIKFNLNGKHIEINLIPENIG